MRTAVWPAALGRRRERGQVAATPGSTAKAASGRQIRTKQRLLLAPPLLLALFLGGCGMLAQPEPTPDYRPPATPTSVPGTLYTVEKGNISETVQVRGQVSAVKDALLFFQLRGYVKSLEMRVGDTVTEGTLLAEMESTDLELEILDIEYRLAKVQLQLQQAQAFHRRVESRLEIARYATAVKKTQKDRAWKDYQGVAHLGDKAWHELAWLENAEISYREAQAEEKQLEDELETKRLDVEIYEGELAYYQTLLDRKRARLAQTRLYAPFTGLIVAVDVQAGENALPYQSIGAIADPGQLQIEVYVMEADIDRVATGQKATVTLDAYPEALHSGTVQQIATKSSLSQGKRSYKVTIGFDDPSRVPTTIRMGADVSITSGIKTDILVIPTQVIFADGHAKYVDVYEDGRAKRTAVSIGATSDGMAEVTSGLKEGQILRIP